MLGHQISSQLRLRYWLWYCYRLCLFWELCDVWNIYPLYWIDLLYFYFEGQKEVFELQLADCLCIFIVKIRCFSITRRWDPITLKLNLCSFSRSNRRSRSFLFFPLNIDILLQIRQSSSAQIKGTLNAASNRALFSSH